MTDDDLKHDWITKLVNRFAVTYTHDGMAVITFFNIVAGKPYSIGSFVMSQQDADQLATTLSTVSLNHNRVRPDTAPLSLL